MQVRQLATGRENGKEQTQKTEAHAKWLYRTVGVRPVDAAGLYPAAQQPVRVVF